MDALSSLHRAQAEPPRGRGRGQGAVLAYLSLGPSASWAWRRSKSPGVALWLGGALARVVGAGVAWVGGVWVRKESSTQFPLSQETPDVLG